MFRKINKLVFVIVGISLVCALFFVSQKSLMQKKEVKTDDALPEGNWSVSFNPYLKDGYADSPVYVASVSNKDAAVTSFEIFNNSQKDVRAFRLKWMVYGDENRQKSLKEGKTPYIRLFNKLVPGKGGRIKYSATSLRKFYESFVENGRLDKDVQVELMVYEVKFVDGSSWKSGDGKSIYVRTKFKKSAKFSVYSKSLTPCAMQKCMANNGAEVGKPGASVVYSCGTSAFRETCVNSADNYSCNNIACDRPPGGGGTGSSGFGFWDEYEYELDWGVSDW